MNISKELAQDALRVANAAKKDGVDGLRQDKVVIRILECASAGLTKIADLADVAGLSRQTLWHYKSKSGPGEYQSCLLLFRYIKKYAAKLKYELVDIVVTYAKEDPKVALQYLTRRYPEEFGKSILEAKVEKNVTHRVELTGPQLTEQINNELHKMGLCMIPKTIEMTVNENGTYEADIPGLGSTETAEAS